MVLPIKSSTTSSASIKSVRDGCQESLPQSTSARPHTASQTVETINHLGFEMLEHPAYSPDLAPSGYHLFGPLKNALRGRRFSTDKEVREAVHKWLRDQL